MCGIVGFVDPAGCDQDKIVSVRDRLHHRGPDDAGMWRNATNTISLGHRRLSILDLTSAGHQPMQSPCGRYVIVFNGEVYNYLELRKELEVKGKVFQGSGDTEVVLAGYAEWGEECLKRFNGMFAIAIYDRGDANSPASLFLARDRTGKKPLYYAHRGRCLAIASELKAIPDLLRGRMDVAALNFYLALGYVPGSHCILSGVKKLSAGHAARFILQSGQLTIWRWWALPAYDVNATFADVDALTEEAEYLLRDSVALRMRSDVPVGILLSGGLDSSLVAACAAQVVPHPIKTFTMGLPGSTLDETDYAALVATHFGTDHHVIEVPKPSLSVLEELAPYIDEPLADSSLIPAYLVSKLTAGHVKVALGGDGGDELFGGYGDYTTALADQARWGWVPGWLFHYAANIASKLPAGVPGRNRISALRGGPLQSLVWGSPFFDAALRKSFLSPEALAELGDDFFSPEMYRFGLFETGADPVDSMTRTHFGSILPDDFLVKVDRTSMAVSLEMRCPLLDVRLVEFAFSRLPSVWKVQGTEGRRLQKRLGRRLLPPALNIERKQGFSIPMNDWLRGADKHWCDGLDKLLPGVIRRSVVNDLIAGQARGRTNGARLFALIMLSIAARNLSL
jgi:asparagine synthase (glutamine-hydrolysing)